jgi:hypothetical protein
MGARPKSDNHSQGEAESPHPRCTVRARPGAMIEEARALLHRLVTSCGKGHHPQGGSFEGRHLGCGRTHLLFAKGCGKRPSSGERESARWNQDPRASGSLVRVDEIFDGLQAHPNRVAATPAAGPSDGATRGVREPIGLGQTSCHAQSWRERPEWTRREPIHSYKRPLTRESSAPERWNDAPLITVRPIPRAGLAPRDGELRRKPSGPTRERGVEGP